MPMTPHQFELEGAPLWDELARGLDALDAGRRASRKRKKAEGTQLPEGPVPGPARVAQLYRQTCEHVALARERAYPIHLVERLEALAARAHDRLYRRSDFGLGALVHLALRGIPDAVHAMSRLILLNAALFVLGAVGAGLAVWHDPHLILTIMDAGTVSRFGRMYGPEAESIGRSAGDDWHMFGHYIWNNIGIAFQCFASGLTLGVGPLFVVVQNAVLAGGLGGFLVTRGDGVRFFSFVITHGAFELTAIVLAGACGLKLGLALLMPGRLTRAQAIRAAATAAAPVVYGLFAMLVVAAALEAFWSSARWIDPAVKFFAGGCAWVLVIGYLVRPGRGGTR